MTRTTRTRRHGFDAWHATLLILASLILLPGAASQAADFGLGAPHNETNNMYCDDCHGGLGGFDGDLLPRDAEQEAMCKSCHNPLGQAASMSNVGNHEVDGGTRVIDCGSCHNVHGWADITDPHTGTVAQNLSYIRADMAKYVAGAVEPAIFRDDPLDAGSLNTYVFDAGPFGGVCQSCHQNTTHWRNDALENPHHNLGTTCTDCHSHENGFGHASGGGTGCESCHGHDAGYEYEPGSFSDGVGTTISHSTHTEDDIDDLKGPNIACSVCHAAGDIPNFATGTDLNFDGRIDLSETDVCDTCHSPAGVYDGVASTGGSVGAKDNWVTGVYAGTVLEAGNELWCVGCHDDAPSNSMADGTGVSARNSVGDDATWGYYITGHGKDPQIDCTLCHSSRMQHIDHIYTPVLDVATTTQNPTNYRFYVGKDLVLPHPDTTATENYKLCFTCHDEATLMSTSGLGTDANTNFRQDNPTSISNYHNQHRSYANCIFCHDPHGTAAPRMTANARIGDFRYIRLNGSSYYELSDPLLWDSVVDNDGGAYTSQTACVDCHVAADLVNGEPATSGRFYTRLLNVVSDLFAVVTDSDADGVLDVNDNCACSANPVQIDSDGDNVGDDCDLCDATYGPSNRDRDGDLLGDVCDACPDDPDNDIDLDGVCGDVDNCPVDPNPDQADVELDGFPDACDNCPLIANADQADFDFDGEGDACDATCDTFLRHWSGYTGSSAPTSASEEIKDIALDASGNVYGVGYTRGTYDGHVLQGGYDFVVIKYDSNGNRLATQQFGGLTGRDEGDGIAVDALGNIYITGWTEGDMDGINQGLRDLVVVKLDGALQVVWTKQFGTASYDMGYDIAVDPAGNVYVVGISSADLVAPSLGGYDAVIYKLDPDGNEVWSNQTGTGASDYGMSIVVDGATSMLYVGIDAGPYVMVKQYDLDGNEGWTAQAASGGWDRTEDIAINDSYVYVTGRTSGAFPGFVQQGDEDVFVLQFDISDGSLLAVDQQVSFELQRAGGIDVGSSGNVYVTGYTYTEFFVPTTGGTDIFLLGYDADLNLLRRKQFGNQGTSNNDTSTGLVVDQTTNDIYISGGSTSSFDGVYAGPYVNFLITKETECTGVDSDGDGVDDAIDNCPLIPNADQADSNRDGIGDACP